MGIKSNFKKENVKKRFDAFLDEIEKEQISVLQRLGEMCVTHARSIPKEQGFEDQTGNLRSSIGYMVFVDGVAVHSFYEQIKEGSEGVKKGKALAEEIGKDQKGVCLVVTAGMNYALALESGNRKKKDGTYYSVAPRDVLTSAEHLAERELPRMLEDLITDIKLTK